MTQHDCPQDCQRQELKDLFVQQTQQYTGQYAGQHGQSVGGQVQGSDGQDGIHRLTLPLLTVYSRTAPGLFRGS